MNSKANGCQLNSCKCVAIAEIPPVHPGHGKALSGSNESANSAKYPFTRTWKGRKQIVNPFLDQ